MVERDLFCEVEVALTVSTPAKGLRDKVVVPVVAKVVVPIAKAVFVLSMAKLAAEESAFAIE